MVRKLKTTRREWYSDQKRSSRHTGASRRSTTTANQRHSCLEATVSPRRAWPPAWVRDKMLADGLDPDAEEPDAKDEEEHAIAESSESVLGPYNGAVMALGAAVLVVFAVSWWRRR